MADLRRLTVFLSSEYLPRRPFKRTSPGGAILDPRQIERLERTWHAGVSARQVSALLTEHGLHVSEASFRKYVQAGLLPRSRRVHRGGLRRGSVGLYPASVIRRIAAIKSLLGTGQTLEQIRDGWLGIRGELDAAESALVRVLTDLERLAGRRRAEGRERDRATAEIERVRVDAARLVQRIERLGSRLTAEAHGADAPNSSGTQE